MAKFDVDVQGVTYEVDAPDENTAWKWAVATHKAEPSKQAEPAIPKTNSSVEQIPTGGVTAPPAQKEQPSFLKMLKDQAVGSLPGRLLTGMAAPVLMAQELAAPAGSKPWSASIKEAQQAGDVIKGPVARAAGTGAEVVGNIINPASLAIMKNTPILKGATGFFPKAGQYLGNVGIGAGAGAALNLTNPTGSTEDLASKKLAQAEEGALFGGGVSAVAAPLISAGARGAGWLTDAMKGRLTDVRAGKTIRDVAGDKLDEVVAAMQGAKGDLSAAQAAAPAGSTRFSALGERTAQNRSQWAQDLKNVQEAEQLASLSGAAGGGTQTAALASRKAAKDALNETTAPIREAAFVNANMAAEKLPKYIEQLGQKRDAVIDALQKAGKEYALENAYRQGIVKAQKTAPGWSQDKIKRLTDRVFEQRELTEGLVKLKNQRQAEGNLIFNQAESLAAHGLRPLETAPIVGKLEAIIKDDSIWPDDISRKAVRSVLEKVREGTSKHGTITAEAIDTIRKKAVNRVIDKEMGAATAKEKAGEATRILEKIKPILVKAVDDASGSTLYSDYLKKYAEGAQDIAGQKLASEAMSRFQKGKQGFLDLVEGNDPKAVQKIMGTEFDVEKALGSRYAPIQDVASQVKRDLTLSDLATAGRTEVADILRQDASKFRLPMWLNRYVTAANKGLDIAEDALNAKTMAKVYDAMKSGKTAIAAIETLPTSEQNKVIKAIIESRGGQNYLIPTAVQSQGER